MPPSRVHRVPFALGSDGKFILNVTNAAEGASVASVLRAAQNDGRSVFVGVVLDAAETRAAMHRLENASAEAAAHISGVRRRRTSVKPGASRRRKTTRA